MIYDLPVIPPEIDDNQRFLSMVHSALDQALDTIESLRNSDEEQFRRPWVFVNAWATYNTEGEDPPGDYTSDINHKFNRMITEMARQYDLVFAAGNCGQFCPSRRCGINDVGPGHSIIGANSHPDVLTVGAVRADGLWLGYSSQGPGTLQYASQAPRTRCDDEIPSRKPDLCAVSQFREDDDAAAMNTGTSAACAIAAGVVAVCRSQFGGRLSSADLKQLLIKTTTVKPSGGWDNRIGHGILHLANALDSVSECWWWPAWQGARLEGKNAAVLIADIAGYGRLMEAAEHRTH